jgi:hypothetical protein
MRALKKAAGSPQQPAPDAAAAACDQSGAQQQPEKPDALQLYNSQVALCWIGKMPFSTRLFCVCVCVRGEENSLLSHSHRPQTLFVFFEIVFCHGP